MGEPWRGQLIEQYTITKHELEAYRHALRQSVPPDKSIDQDTLDTLSTLGRMIADLQYGMTWMRTGREPGSRRGAERRSAYEQSIIMDTDLFPSLMVEPDDELSNDDRRRITEVLLLLTDRERQVYILSKAYNLSQREIAAELNISRRRVRDCLRMADNKIKNAPTSRPFAHYR